MDEAHEASASSLPSCEGSGLKWLRKGEIAYDRSLPSCEGSGLKLLHQLNLRATSGSPLV